MWFGVLDAVLNRNTYLPLTCRRFWNTISKGTKILYYQQLDCVCFMIMPCRGCRDTQVGLEHSCLGANSIYEYKNMPWILSQNPYKAWSNRKQSLSAELISNKATLQSGDQHEGSWGFPFSAQVRQSLWPAETPEIPELSAPRRLIAIRVAPGLFYHL